METKKIVYEAGLGILFKSYYVVWKLHLRGNYAHARFCLNRTM